MKYIFFFIALLITPITFVSAQLNTNLGNSEIVIDLNPAFPEPGSIFKASLNDYSFPGQVSSISWRVDGKILSESANQRTISLTNKEAGSETIIEAILEISGRGEITIKRTVSPVNVDIIIEPQTKTPSFYKGRALPSVGSTVNLTALLSGVTTPASGFVYTWKVNNQAVNGGSTIRSNRSTITVPIGQLVLISVDVQRVDGTLVGRKIVEIPSVEPAFYFYELNSLYGLNNKALKNFNLIGDSVTVRAEPYNLDINTYNNPGHLEWKINGNINNNPTSNPYEVTLARLDAFTTGSSKATLHVRNLEQLLQGARGEFQVNF